MGRVSSRGGKKEIVHRQGNGRRRASGAFQGGEGSGGDADVRKALEYRIEFERIIMSISSAFISIPFEMIDKEIDKALARIGRFVRADRSYVFMYTPSGDAFDNTNEWCARGIAPQKENLQNIPESAVPWWTRKLKRFETIYIPSVQELPSAARAEKEILSRQGIQSLVAVPIICEGILKGFAGFDWVRTQKRWDDDVIALLTFVGEIIANALARKEIDREKSEFVLLVSHQLRTPLSVLQWATELLEREVSPQLSHEHREYVKSVRDVSDRLGRTIRSFLDVSHIELGTIRVRRERTVLQKVAEEMQVVFKGLAEQKGVDFLSRFSGLQKEVIADARLIKTIIENVLSNAVQYTPRGGKVRFEMSVQSARSLPSPVCRRAEAICKSGRPVLFVRVSDTGYGISEEDKKRIFLKLFRGKKAVRHDPDGNGLGLYIAKSFAEKAGGTLWFTSRVSKGSTFFVLVPVDRPARKR